MDFYAMFDQVVALLQPSRRSACEAGDGSDTPSLLNQLGTAETVEVLTHSLYTGPEEESLLEDWVWNFGRCSFDRLHGKRGSGEGVIHLVLLSSCLCEQMGHLPDQRWVPDLLGKPQRLIEGCLGWAPLPHPQGDLTPVVAVLGLGEAVVDRRERLAIFSQPNVSQAAEG